MAEILDQPFDPFRHRLSRDLRNDLSEALLAALTEGDPARIPETVARYRQRTDLGPALAEYLERRLACYRVILTESEASGGNPDRLARSFWNHELFFEFHELLEKRWLRATGAEKEILQALIRAAGAYIHRRSGNVSGAAKMAARAREIISRYPTRLPSGFEAAPLLAALDDPAAPPPHFGAPARNRTGPGCGHVGP